MTTIACKCDKQGEGRSNKNEMGNMDVIKMHEFVNGAVKMDVN